MQLSILKLIFISYIIHSTDYIAKLSFLYMQNDKDKSAIAVYSYSIITLLKLKLTGIIIH